MQTICKQCKSTFQISSWDREFYQKMMVPEPSTCPDCRMQLLQAFHPGTKLYHRKSDQSGKPIISMHSADKLYPVYSVDEWWSDSWDALDYGRDFDFSKPFFPQFFELYNAVPHMANLNAKSENCDFSNSVGNSKNVYYSFKIYRSEDVYYSNRCTAYNNNLFNCTSCFQSSYLNNCVDCHECHLSQNLFQCDNCRNSYFSIDCRGCSEIIFCTNLRNKNYCIFNEQLSEKAYFQKKSAILDGKYFTYLENLKKFQEIWLKKPWRAANMINCENCTGSNLHNCSNVKDCFDSNNLQDSKYVWNATPSETLVNSMDIGSGGIGAWLYNSVSLGGGNYFMRCCFACRYSDNLTYCADCYTCSDCFGCVGLRNKKYCIFNKQYSKEKYCKLRDKIIEKIKLDGIWGEFFPLKNAPLAYNETHAQADFPSTKEKVIKNGWKWHDEEKTVQKIATTTLPDDNKNISAEIFNSAIGCEVTGKPFKILPQELKFYQEHQIPLPRKHPEIRMQERMQMSNHNKLFERTCAKCKKPIKTTYAPDRPEIVYCEQCYLKEVY
jgi:hypothetical protein